MITIEFRDWVVPSQNVRDRRHWSKDNAEKRRLTIIARSGVRTPCPHGAFRYVEVMCWRAQRIADEANYRGGAKGLIDALVKAGAIADDNDKVVSITYRQATLKHSPFYGRPLTRVRVSPEPIPEE